MQAVQDNVSFATFDAISKDSGKENATLEADDCDGRVSAPDLPRDEYETAADNDGGMTGSVVMNKEPLPDGWWFIPPNVSLEQYLSAGVASVLPGTTTQKMKKKRKAKNGATHANDSIALQADLPQETVGSAEQEQNIPLTTVAPNLRAAGTVIASLLERFPEEFANFNAKLREFYDANVPNGDSNRLKQDIRWMINDLMSKAKQLLKSEMYIVGSTVNGCGTMGSDLDMCLVAEDADGGHPTDKQYVMDTLSDVKRTLINDYRKRFRNVKLIPHATVPIITFDVVLAGFVVHVDINVNQLFGIRNSSLLLLYSKVDKRFSILCVLVRQWAKLKGIGNARCGGLNSYTLNLMVLHYLTFASEPPTLPNLQKMYPHLWDLSTKLCAVNKAKLPSGLKWKSKNKKTVGELVLGFFDYFAHFDFDAYGISTAEGYTMKRESFPSAMQKYNIIVMDPFEPVNAARTIFKHSYPIVLHAFRSFVLDVFGESVLHPPCESPNDAAGDVYAASEATNARQEAEHCAKPDSGIAEAQIADAGDVETSPEANDDQQEAKNCIKSDTGDAESHAAKENPQHSDVRSNGSEAIVHQEYGELPNDAGETGPASEADDDRQDAEHCVKPDRGIIEVHRHGDVSTNGGENMFNQEKIAAGSSVIASSGEQQSSGDVSGAAKETPRAAERPMKTRRTRLSKIRKHCCCL